MIDRNEFLEWERVHESFYGTSKTWVEEKLNLGKNIILDIDVKGAKHIKSIMDANFIFIEPPSMEILATRIKNRNTENSIAIEKRLSVAKEELKEKNFFDFVIKNDVLEESIKKLKNIINNEIFRR